jgi:hypothetical protein
MHSRLMMFSVLRPDIDHVAFGCFHRCHPCDRAKVVAPNILTLTALSSIPPAERRECLENMLRDEFADAARQARDDDTPGDR